MKKFKFKDGSIITASSAEEAKEKHKVIAMPKGGKRKASVPVSLIKKLISLGFSDEYGYADLNSEQNNFDSMLFDTNKSNNWITLRQVAAGKIFILIIENEYEEVELKSFKTLEEAVKFLEKPGVMFTLKEFV